MAKDLVLITGATGHIGFRTLVLLLQAGYRARITHRRPEQVDKIKSAKSVQHFLDSIEFVQVPDITTPDAYDEAIKGVDYVEHIASPIPSTVPPGDRDWQRHLYDPAEKGVTNILAAASKERSVKRVIMTSSGIVVEAKNGAAKAGPRDVKDVPDFQTRSNWENVSPAYVTSKILSHVAANNFVEQNKVHFDFVRVLPCFTQGANELYASAQEMRDPSLQGSNSGLMDIALGVRTGKPHARLQVYLEDVAKAHVLALKPEHARHGDDLLIAGNGGISFPWQDVVDVIKQEYPEAVKEGILAPSAEEPEFGVDYDVGSSEKALGFEFAGAKEMTRSVIDQYLSLVRLEKPGS